jgi:hypothetical protein
MSFFRKLIETREDDIEFAKKSLHEELVAINAYKQRIKMSSCPILKKILIHNLKEEKNHAVLLRNWLKRYSQRK